ncbi:MAG: hypothetical protein OI74_04565 [Gammaproteobacteria bacterium (ex Lamellibrachia satsuma)]|nr:MAG: hypothetical protein OI74_04565 [Gammaproteobacteria bacterium (ex Lamellibrachia satsuma)]RRS35281.1 MAG: hypothetical protein NV67_11005 [Gammaproteobacteria bacterium (ex Lamellibrachia satsuma)]
MKSAVKKRTLNIVRNPAGALNKSFFLLSNPDMRHKETKKAHDLLRRFQETLAPLPSAIHDG